MKLNQLRKEIKHLQIELIYQKHAKKLYQNFKTILIRTNLLKL